MPNVQSTSSASLLYKAFLTLLGCDEIIRYTTSTRSRPVDDWLPKEKIVIHQLHGKTLKIPPSLFSVPLLSMGKRGIIYKTYNKVFLFSLRLGLNRLCSHNLKLCFGRHPISKDWMVYEIHLRTRSAVNAFDHVILIFYRDSRVDLCRSLILELCFFCKRKVIGTESIYRHQPSLSLRHSPSWCGPHALT